MFNSFNFRRQGEDALSATQRKRNRDRQAQQKLREKRNSHVQQLERQVALCKEHHGHTPPDSRSEQMRLLEIENTKLRARAQQLSQLADSVCQTVSQMKELMGDTMMSSSLALPPLMNVDVVTTSPNSAPQTSRNCHPRLSKLLCTAVNVAPSEEQLGDNSQEIGDQDTSSPSWTTSPGLGDLHYSVLQGVDPQHFDYNSNFSPVACSSSVDDNTSRTFLAAANTLPTPLTNDTDTDPGFGMGSDYSSSRGLRRTRYNGAQNSAGLFYDSARRSTSLASSLEQGKNSEARRKTSTPSWTQLPNSDLNHAIGRETMSWMCFPEAIAASPALPNPIDILFGSHSNFLANEIHKLLRKSRVSEPERLANGWLLYVYSKWRTNPSKESFDQVPKFLRPLPEQVEQEHLSYYDIIYWPPLRLNLMRMKKEDPFHDPSDVFRALACCAKVRWPWGKEILRTTEQGNREIDPEFLNTFTHLEGWGLTLDFIKEFLPALKGLAIDSILFIVT